MNEILIKAPKLTEIVKNIFLNLGCPTHDAQIIADVLVMAELRGIPSHGIARVMDYVSLFKVGRINEKPIPKISYQTISTATIDGDNAFGMIPAKMAMNLAIEKAEKTGSAWVNVFNSNHFGIAGYYSLMAVEKNMIGIAMTNANALVAPTFSVSRFLGTNPLAVAIPCGKYKPFVADFATTPIARGKLALMEKKGEKAPIGFVQDKWGNPSTDPSILKEGGAILPLGGDYEHGSHKGYCMGAIVDIFSAVLGGANFGPFVPPQVSYLPLNPNMQGKGLGHFFGVFRIDAFSPADDFLHYMEKWCETFKNASPAKGYSQVLIPGEPEDINTEHNLVHGISIIEKTWTDLLEIANEYKVNIS